MRNLIRIVETACALDEEINPMGAYFLHVSPSQNLRSILRVGLQQNDLGNYSGYETSLPGVYVTRHPEIIRQHISARQMEKHYVLVVVQVNSSVVIDEDAIDGHLHAALVNVAKLHGVSIDRLVDEYENDDETDVDYSYTKIGQEMLPFMLRNLGPVSPSNDFDVKSLLAEFCSAWFGERMIGGDGPEGDWWAEAKDRIVRAFPALSHVTHGKDYSLRIPSPVGYEGDTRIIAVVEVKNGRPKIVKGALPNEAKSLVDDVV